MAETNQLLNYYIIDDNDQIGEMIQKINYNFTQFALNNGGTPGVNGENGSDGMVSLSRCAIHAIPLKDVTIKNENGEELNKYTNEKNKYNSEEVVSYFNENKPDDMMKDDIVIYGPCIFQYDGSSYIEISRIIGEKGESGNDAISDEAYITSLNLNNNEDDKRILLNDGIKGLILDTMDLNTGNNPLSTDNNISDINYSLLFTRLKDDGMVFFTLKEGKRVKDTKIYHHYHNDENVITTQFNIVDNSTNGSYYSSSNKMVLQSIYNDNKYGYSIELGNNDALNIKSDCDININFKNALNINYDTESIIKFEKDKLSLNGLIDIDKTEHIINLNGDVNFKDFGSIKINEGLDINIKSGNITLNNTILSDISDKDNQTWYIDSQTGISKFSDIYVGNLQFSKITDTFAISSGGLNQFVNNYKSHNISKGESEEVAKENAKKELRDEIGALSSKDFEDMTFTIYTYEPVGSIITTLLYTEQFISDSNGCLYVLCNGRKIEFTKDSKGNYITVVTAKNIVLNTSKDNNITLTLSDKFKNSQLCSKSGDKYYINVPDLGGRFLAGYNGTDYKYNKIGKTGGKDSVKLTVDEMPQHSHEYAGNEDMKNSTPYSPFLVNPRTSVHKSGGDRSSGYLYYTKTEGGNGAHENRPPYYTVSYYMKLLNPGGTN